MNDRRLTPDPALMKQNTVAQVITAVADLCRAAGGVRDRQLLFGDAVTLLSSDAGWSYVQSGKDRYCGFLKTEALGNASIPTHKVIAPATHIYERPDFKSPDLLSLSFGSLVRVTDHADKFAKTDLGYVPLTHLADSSILMKDPADIAALFLGTPYLWGGNSRWGIDCSGLVQAAFLACGIPCPGDSDQQQSIGRPAKGAYKRGDLMFWKGHVALVTDADTLIHANAHAMSVVYESISTAIDRIKSQDDGPVTAHRRI